MTVFLFLASILFLGLGVIWGRRDFLNLTLKLVFLCMAAFGGGLIFIQAVGA